MGQYGQPPQALAGRLVSSPAVAQWGIRHHGQQRKKHIDHILQCARVHLHEYATVYRKKLESVGVYNIIIARFSAQFTV